MEQNQKKNDAITRQEDDFGQWYTDICLKAELMDYARAKDSSYIVLMATLFGKTFKVGSIRRLRKQDTKMFICLV